MRTRLLRLGHLMACRRGRAHCGFPFGSRSDERSSDVRAAAVASWRGGPGAGAFGGGHRDSRGPRRPEGSPGCALPASLLRHRGLCGRAGRRDPAAGGAPGSSERGRVCGVGLSALGRGARPVGRAGGGVGAPGSAVAVDRGRVPSAARPGAGRSPRSGLPGPGGVRGTGARRAVRSPHRLRESTRSGGGEDGRAHLRAGPPTPGGRAAGAGVR